MGRGTARNTPEKIFTNVERITETGCWLWLGARTNKGYGTATLNAKTVAVHRLSYQHFNGEIPKGLHICHTCDVRSCCNPAHLYAGTNSDNMLDMWARGGRERKWKTRRNTQ